MVFVAPLVGAAVLFSGMASALPSRANAARDNSYNGGSNYGGSSYNSNNGNNYGGSSYNNGNNYGGNSNNYDSSSYNNNNYYTSSTDNQYETSTSSYDNNNYYTTSSSYDNNNYYTTSSSYDNNNYYTTTSSTYEVQATSTSYGSGSSYWGGSGYDDCVNQCIAQYGGPSMGGSYQATQTVGTGGSYGTGSTHTVIVAPTQGVLRFIPFATNASVGDTVEFHWGANNHTVTKSSALTPCNKSSDAPVFASGEQNDGFVFSQVVNDTNPVFYYCGTPGHCEKGMFGIINPPQAVPGAPSSVAGMMAAMAANDSDLSAYAAYSNNLTSNNAEAAAWGTNIDLSAIPEWAQSLVATNVLYTQAVLAMNTETIGADNSVDLSSVSSTPLMLPMDITGALDAAAAPGASSASQPAAPAVQAAATSAETSASATASTSGAESLVSSRLMVAAFVVVATFFAL
ncbi:Phytocyanin domain-containing protein [Mycena chlorophos]|uniref:Phytocyanin domain-containing protein n=1 Tax=Mycena chlorophos TaxID=658473 RepID=A0A8H6TTA8_MYCCL|nr:Phytocyanin domain-containing protein [Mycena chlorophos]